MYAIYFGLYLSHPQASQYKNLTMKNVIKLYGDIFDSRYYL